jgi:hypothetical protein
VSDEESKKPKKPSKGKGEPRLVAALPVERKLSDAHREHLRTSGLTDETLDLAQLYSERRPAALAELLCWKAWPTSRGDGLVFPFLLPGSDAPVMYRVRPTRPRTYTSETSGKTKTIKYEQPKDVHVEPYLTPRARAGGWYADVEKPLVWLEGEKKALLVDQLGYAAIGGTGVFCFHDAKHKDEQGVWRVHGTIRDHVALAGRTHLIAFDSDAETNADVMLAARRLAGMLEAAGGVPKFIRIPGLESGEKLGIDDFFVVHGEAATRALLAGGERIEPLPVEDTFTPLTSIKAFKDAPIEKRLRLPWGFKVDNHGGLYEMVLGKDGAEPKETFVAHSAILLRRVLIDLYTGEERIEVTFARQGGWRKAVVDRRVLVDARMLVAELASIGAPVDSNNAAKVVKWLTDLEAVNESRLPRTTCVTRCGWHDLEDEHVFLAPDPIGTERELVFDDRMGRARTVRGLRVKGESESHLIALRRAFTADNIAATAICASLAAPLLRALSTPGFALHLVGDSSRGKSSMLKIAASIFGDPTCEDWVPSWNSTIVGLEQRAATLCDLPFCIDEAGVVDPKQRELATYMLIDGVGRTRGAKGGGLRETSSWRTIVLSTGEHELVDEDANTGAQVRVLQFHVHCFGDLDANGVDTIRNACAEHHGEVGRAWLEALAGLDWIAARAAHREYVRRARAQMVSSGLRARQVEYFATLAFAESLAAQHLGLGDPNGATMMRWLLEDDESAPRDQHRVLSVAERALALVRDLFVSQGSSLARIDEDLFDGPTARTSSIKDLLGYHDADTIAFVPTRLKGYLKAHGVSVSVLREWERRGWLITNEGRQTHRRRIGGDLVRLVTFKRGVLTGTEGPEGGVNAHSQT